MRTPLLPILVLTGSFALAQTAHAQCAGCCTPEEVFPLAGQTPGVDGADQFGTSVDSLANFLAVGTPGFNDLVGAVFVYKRDGGTWALDGVLHPPAGSGTGRFGFSVSIARGLILVGAPDADVPGLGSGTGSAYVYRRDPGGWAFEQELPPSSGSYSNHGWAVDLDSTSAVIGGKGEEAAYFWVRRPGACGADPWCFEDKVTPPGGLNGLCYAEAVSISGNTAIVGGSEFHMFTNVGAVFHYERFGSDWILQEDAIINPMFSGPGEHFGETVSLQGDWLLVGEPKGGGGGDGLVFVYERNPDGTFGPGTAYEQILDDGPESTTFGRSISFRGRVAVIGAPFKDIGIIGDAGIAYRYDLVGGSFVHTDTYEPCGLLDNGDRFGFSVAVGSKIAIAAHQDDYSGFIDAGTVYTFEK